MLGAVLSGHASSRGVILPFCVQMESVTCVHYCVYSTDMY